MKTLQNPNSTYNIVVVDDTPANLRLLTTLLTQQGYDVRPAINGQLALSAVRAMLPDLILLDIMMPDLSGYEVCRELKADERTRDIPIIFISALDNEVDKVHAFRVGGVDYIPKPFQQAEVVARVNNQLRLLTANRQLKIQNEQLKRFSGDLRELHRLHRTVYQNFENLAQDYLKTGCELLGFTKGMIEARSSSGLICQAQESLTDGEVTGHEPWTQRVIEQQQTLIYDDLTRETEHLGSYIGTPIWVDGQVYGSLTFCSPLPRYLETETPQMQCHDVEILELMAQSLGKYIMGHQGELRRRGEAVRRAKAEEATQVLLRVTQAINHAPDFELALEAALAELCVSSGWTYGEAWVPRSSGDCLECSLASYIHEAQLADYPEIYQRIQAFQEASETMTLGRGEGLAGRVWATGEQVYLQDLRDGESLVRQDLAQACRFKMALAIPIWGGRGTPEHCPDWGRGDEASGHQVYREMPLSPPPLAVLVFFRCESMDGLEGDEERLLQFVSAITAQLGTVIQKKQTEAELRTIFATMDDLISLYDREGRCLKFTNTKSNFFLKPPAELLNKTLAEVLPEELAAFHQEAIDRALSDRTTQRLEYSLMMGPALRWFSTNISPMSEDTVLFVTRDITESKTIQEELFAAQARFQAIFESASLGIAVMALDGTLMDSNAAFQDFLGYLAEELQGLTLDSFTDPRDVNLDAQDFENLLLGRTQAYSVEKRYIRSDTSLVWGRLTVCAVKKGGVVEFIFGLMEDISEAQRAAEETQLLLNITQAFVNAPDLDSALTAALEQVCLSSGWGYGEVWIPSLDGERLECSPAWYIEPTIEGETQENMQAFRAESEGLTFERGEGLPGHVWLQGEPEFFQLGDTLDRNIGLHYFNRRGLAEQRGIQAGLAVPIVIPPILTIDPPEPGRVLAVLVFFRFQSFSLNPLPEDERLAELIFSVATQLGTIMQHKQTEAELQAILAAMDDLVLIRDRTGRCVKVAHTKAKALQQGQSLYPGQSLQERFTPELTQAHLACIQESLTTGQPTSLEYTVTVDRDEICLDGRFSPISQQAVVVVARDISQRKMVEEKLRANEAEMRGIFEAMTDVVLVINARKQEIQVMPTNYSKLYGERDVVSEVFSKFFGSDCRAEFWRPVEEAIASHQTVSFDYSLDNGEQTIWFDASISPLPQQFVIWVARDISDRVQAELELQTLTSQLEERILNRTAQLREANHILRAEVTARVEAEEKLQKAYERVQLLSELTLKIRQSLDLEDILQTTVIEVQRVLNVDRVLLVQERPDGLKNSIREVVLDPWPTVESQGCYDDIMQHKGITTLQQDQVLVIPDVTALELPPAEQDFLTRLQVKAKLVIPIFYQDQLWGKLVLHQCQDIRPWHQDEIELLTALVDQIAIALSQAKLLNHLEELVTARTAELRRANTKLQQEIRDRLLAELALRRSEMQLRLITDALPVLISYVDAEQRYRFHNKTYGDWFGLSRDQITGRSAEEVLGHLYPFIQKYIQAALAGQKINFELQTPKINGQSRYISVTFIPDQTGDGGVRGYFGVMVDISDRKAVEQMKDDFLSIASHELRTPLTSIRGSLGLLATGRLGTLDSKGQQMLSIAVKNTERLTRLLNDILDLERIASGRVEMCKQACNAPELMLSAKDAMQSMAEQEGITLKLEVDHHPLPSPPPSIPLQVDPDQIQQTLTNLISNAIKFSRPENFVWIGVVAGTEEIQFYVRDRGRGIPADKLEAIFGRFQQVDASDSREKGGTGLGLPICREIVQQHGGKIWVESILGEGSTFYFTLPLGDQLF
ncbi:PAS domain S-box protein [Spirulina subsalsa FACHB-351]|uniref:histidine kinase n=1 Tax=Spirulina subsalsa FACHB-351 TaxID=234711 RepID=A0ABT3L6N1_9CYAN|nr:PAS domain S-box protein [Spirulina subsalsa]MCW6037154.1 PAS domain S-box protein [Spirulina subsalsa FACHB-351]